MRSLEEGLCFPIPRVDDSIFFAAPLRGLEAEFCVGAGTVQQGFDPAQFKRPIIIQPNRFVTDLWGAQLIDTRPDIKMHSKASFVTWKEGDADVTRHLVELGSCRSEARGITTHILSFPARETETQLQPQLAHETETQLQPPLQMSVHLLMQIQIDTLKLSPRYDEPLLEALDGQTLEVHFPRSNKSRSKAKYAGLAASDGLATVCDVDHRIGRANLWQNGAWFTRAVRHGHNTALSHTRQEAGDWLFGLVAIKYTCGEY